MYYSMSFNDFFSAFHILKEHLLAYVIYAVNKFNRAISTQVVVLSLFYLVDHPNFRYLRVVFRPKVSGYALHPQPIKTRIMFA